MKGNMHFTLPDSIPLELNVVRGYRFDVKNSGNFCLSCLILWKTSMQFIGMCIATILGMSNFASYVNRPLTYKDISNTRFSVFYMLRLKPGL